MSDLAKDASYGFRQLCRSPGFAVTAVLSLALGIGANAAIFQLVDAIRLRLLPVRNPKELMMLNFEKPAYRSGNSSTRSAHFTSDQLAALKRDAQPFSSVAAWSASRFNLTSGGEARYAEGLFVSGNFFPTLGVSAVLGRTLTEQDDTAACPAPGAVISHSFWQREFNSDQDVLGRTITLNNKRFPILGVTPPDFYGVETGYRYDAAVPLCADRIMSTDKGGRANSPEEWWLSAIARLKPGWTEERARAYLHAASPAFMRATVPPTYRPDVVAKYLKNKISVESAATASTPIRSQYEQPLWVLMTTTGLVLLIACANLANLLLARASVRQREFAVRLAIGASRARLIRQLLAESFLLATLGAGLGAFLAQGLSHGLASFLETADDAVVLQLSWDWRTIAFTAGLAFATCILFGLIPALRATRIAPASAMRTGGRGTTAGKERFSLRRALVVTQVALSLVLLAGALLFTRSLRGLMTTDMGFRPEGILTVDVTYSDSGHPKPQRYEFNRQLRQRVAGVPGVVAVAETTILPVSGNRWNDYIGPDDTRAANSGKISLFSGISPGYFETTGTRLLAGRDITDRDTMSAPKIALVNVQFAKQYFGGKNPVGRTFHVSAPAGKAEEVIQVIGLVQNTKYGTLKEDFQPIAYLPAMQQPDPDPEAQLLVRINGPVGSITNSIKQSMAGVDSTMSLTFRSFSRQVDESVRRESMLAALSAAFGILAELLATLGLYGVISYMVGRRRNEIGVRMALGADRRSVLRLVLGEAVALLAIGLAAGTVIVLWAGRAAASLLYGLKPSDPLTIASAVVLLAGIALVASYFPARRAARLDPMLALRDE